MKAPSGGVPLQMSGERLTPSCFNFDFWVKQQEMPPSTPPLDPFTRRRLTRFVDEFRSKNGQLPTLQDLSTGGFSDDAVKAALKDKVIEPFYVTLTNGTIVKGFKLL
jgi:hypothetical protein